MATGAGIRFSVRLVPRGGRDAIDGVGEAGELRCRVSAPPVEGAANRALVRLVAGALGVAPSSVALEAGAGARTKRLRVTGVPMDALLQRFPGLAASD